MRAILKSDDAALYKLVCDISLVLFSPGSVEADVG